MHDGSVGEKKEKGADKILKEIMAKNFSNIRKSSQIFYNETDQEKQYIPKRIECRVSKRSLYTHVHTSVIHNSYSKCPSIHK